MPYTRHFLDLWILSIIVFFGLGSIYGGNDDTSLIAEEGFQVNTQGLEYKIQSHVGLSREKPNDSDCRCGKGFLLGFVSQPNLTKVVQCQERTRLCEASLRADTHRQAERTQQGCY